MSHTLYQDYTYSLNCYHLNYEYKCREGQGLDS